MFKIIKRYNILFLVAVMLLPLSLSAQKSSSSINTYSPYTFYGLGDLSTLGTTMQRSMGGVGVAQRSPMFVNYLNPAAASVAARRSFMFNVDLEGGNFYNKSEVAKTSFNTFNFKNITLQFPLANKIGFSFSMTPYSSVGYNTEKQETDPLIIASLGNVLYKYKGEGNVSQFKSGIGIEVLPHLSLGAEAIYYKGNIKRSYDTEITPFLSSGTYSNVSCDDFSSMSHWGLGFGAQYTAIQDAKQVMTLGATYKSATKLDETVVRGMYSDNAYGDLIYFSSTESPVTIPTSVAFGAFYAKNSWAIEADYSYENWGDANKSISYDSGLGVVNYNNVSSIKLGGEYTPNKKDIRSYLKRVSYRLGLNYSGNYLSYEGNDLTDKAITIGAGLPIGIRGASYINLGAELGERGTTANNLIKERYFKFSVGLSLFGEDNWFVKPKYD